MKLKEIKLTMKQAQRFSVAEALIHKRITAQQAADSLNISKRHILRIKKRVRNAGPAGVLHKNAGKSPHNKIPEPTQKKIIELATKIYADFNFSHLSDILLEKHKITISDETLRRWLRPLGLGKSQKRKTKKHFHRRKRKEREGEMLFLDGSPHHWFGENNPESCLILASDDATGKPLYGKFQPAEDRDGCFEVCYRVFKKYGLPSSFYLDRASQFTTTRHEGLHIKQNDEKNTHFENAMQELAIHPIFANSPQARGRGERLNGSFQNRLVAELALHKITTCKEATGFLNKNFIPRYCRKFAKTPQDPVAAWRKVPEGADLKNTLAARFTRTVSNDNTISIYGKVYQLYPTNDCRIAGSKLDVRAHFDKHLHFFHPRYGKIKARLL